MKPGTVLTACDDQFGCSPAGISVQADGTVSTVSLGPIFACDTLTNVYFTAVTASGDSIESNVVASAPCSQPS